jgi:hypothetical protein
LKWISDKFVLLFDVEDKRAWLVDGASALLHLLRASIQKLQDDDVFGMHCQVRCLKESALQADGRSAAVSILSNEEEMNKVLFANPVDQWEETTVDPLGMPITVVKTKRTFILLHHKVQQLFRVLEQIVDHQEAASMVDGFCIRIPHRRLEGFDFSDIVDDKYPFFPRVYLPREFGKSWTVFTTAIHAVTLFGKGFGELIQAEAPIYPYWAEVPKHREYLTIISTLKELAETAQVPWHLAGDVYWHSPGKTFEPCSCKDDPSAIPCNRAQVLMPSRFKKLWHREIKSPAYLEDEGAIIFGGSPLKRVRRAS